MDNYFELLQHPLWQKKKAEIIIRDGRCQTCPRIDITLHVHHKYYKPDTNPWDYPNEALITICEVCHNNQHLVGKNLSQQDLINIILEQPMMIGMLSQLCVLIEESPDFEKELRIFLRNQISIYYSNRKK